MDFNYDELKDWRDNARSVLKREIERLSERGSGLPKRFYTKKSR